MRYQIRHAIVKYAVCYANQLEESLVTDIYDVEMHEIYTETEVIRKGV